MDTKHYLQQIEKADRTIQNKLAELYQLRCLVTNITATSDKEPISFTGQSSDKVGNLVAKIVDLEREINSEIDNFINLKQKCVKAIESVPNPLQYTVLHKRYIQYKSLVDIALEENYTYQYIVETHSKALKNVKNL